MTMKPLAVLAIGAALLGAIPAHAAGNITRLEMGFDIGNGIVPPAGPSRVRVPPGERVFLIVPAPVTTAAADTTAIETGGLVGPIQWTKDGEPIPGATSLTYEIRSATTTDRGLYSISGVRWPTVATGIDLDVVPQGHTANLSSRVELAPKAVHVVGFVVSGRSPKSYLFRAVGPTLKVFGIENPAPRPRIRCFDSAGNEVSFPHPAVVIDVNALFVSVGAFPVSDEEVNTVSYDYGPLKPGAYTLQVSDDSGGTALVELYEMTDSAVIRPAS